MHHNEDRCTFQGDKATRHKCLPSLEPFKVTGQFLGKLKQWVRQRRLYISLFMVLALCYVQFSLR